MNPEEKATGETASPPADNAEILPKLESKIASQDKKITYLISKLSKMDAKKDVVEVEAASAVEPIEDRLVEIKRVLIDHGLEIAGFNENGIIKLKPINEAGFDTLRKLNTLFHISYLETYFDQFLT